MEELFSDAFATQDRSHAENFKAAQRLLLALASSNGELKPAQILQIKKLQGRYPDLSWQDILPPPEPRYETINLHNLSLTRLCGVHRDDFSPATPLFSGLFAASGQCLKQFAESITSRPADNLQPYFYNTGGSFSPLSAPAYLARGLNFQAAIAAYQPPQNQYTWKVDLLTQRLPLAQVRLIDNPTVIVTAIDFSPDERLELDKYQRATEKPMEILNGQLDLFWTGKSVSKQNFTQLFKNTFSC